MKKIFLSLILCFVLLFSGCALTGKEKFENPITDISVDIKSQTLLVGESIDFHVSTLPVNTDEDIKIRTSNPFVVELSESKINAIGIGEAEISFSSESNSKTKSIFIRVVEEIESYSSFYSSNSSKFSKAIVTVYCRSFNRNWLGIDVDEKTTYGKGIIIEKIGFNAYFVTDKRILESPADRQYEEWYIKDYNGTKYEIPGIKAHKDTKIAIGSFSSTNISNYPAVEMSQSRIYNNDYAIIPSENKLSTVCESNGVSFYVNTTITAYSGYAVLNDKCELIGIAMKNDGTKTEVYGIPFIMNVYEEVFSAEKNV